MEVQAIDRTKQQTSHVGLIKLSKLSVGGGLAFFAVTIAFSLLPIAAEYRAALSMSYASVVAGALIAGLIIGFCISYFLVRLSDKMPTESAVAKALMISCVALLPAIGMVGVAAHGLQAHGWHYFLIGAMLNVPRFLALGIAVGYLYTRLYGSVRSAIPGSQGNR